jgi:hypothetical protein
MIQLIDNPTGKTAVIQSIQKRLHSELTELWNLPDNEKKNLDAFGKCYILNRDGKKTIERFKQGKDYENVAVANKSKLFFIQTKSSKPNGQNLFTTELEVIFIIDISIAKPNIQHRSEQESQVTADVNNILTTVDNVFILSIEEGYEKSLNGAYYEQSNDMQPYFVFKFILKIDYDINQECNCC